MLEGFPGPRDTTCRTAADLLPNTALNGSMREHMAKACPITEKGSIVGGRYSNRTRATQFNPCGKLRRQPNLQKRKIFVPELNKSVIVNISTKGLKTLQKNGAFKTLKEAGLL